MWYNSTHKQGVRQHMRAQCLIRLHLSRHTMEKAHSRICNKAASLLAAMICINRRRKRLTQQQLADHVGVSRATIQKIERGDMRTSIGHVFEVAVRSGVRLFDMDDSNLTRPDRHFVEKLALLPRRVRVHTVELDDDF